MWVGGYELQFYCERDNPAHAYEEFPRVYSGEVGSECRARARRTGLDRQERRHRRLPEVRRGLPPRDGS
jgi:hypothetical protein